METIQNPRPAVSDQQIKGCLLSPAKWFLLAVGASILDFFSSICTALMPHPQASQGAVAAQAAPALVFALIWLALRWLVVWKRWSHAGVRKKRYLGWTYGQGAFVFLGYIGVAYLLLAWTEIVKQTTGLMPFFLGSLTFSILSTLAWTAQTIAMPSKAFVESSQISGTMVPSEKNRYTISALLQITAAIAILCSSYYWLPSVHGFEGNKANSMFFTCSLVGAALVSLVIALTLHPIMSWHFTQSLLASTIISSWIGYLAAVLFSLMRESDDSGMSAVLLLPGSFMVAAVSSIFVSFSFDREFLNRKD